MRAYLIDLMSSYHLSIFLDADSWSTAARPLRIRPTALLSVVVQFGEWATIHFTSDILNLTPNGSELQRQILGQYATLTAILGLEVSMPSQTPFDADALPRWY